MDKNVRIARELVRIAKEMSAAADDNAKEKSAADDNGGSFKMPNEPFNLLINKNNPNQLAEKAQDWLAENEMCIVCGEANEEMMLLFKDKDWHKCEEFCEKVNAGIKYVKKLVKDNANALVKDNDLVKRGIVENVSVEVENVSVKTKYSRLDIISCYKNDGKNGFHMDRSYVLG